jgi:threonyl-tRNA synthetase
MFDPIAVEGEAYQLRPMNCPFHVQARLLSSLVLFIC